MKHIKSWLKSPIHVMGMLVLIAVLGMSTIAYFTDVEAAINGISVGTIDTEVEEDIDTPVTKKNIKVRNTGHSAAYIRIRVDIPSVTYPYMDESGQEQTGGAQITLPDGNDPQKLSFTDWSRLTEITSGDYIWEKKADGYWYLNELLPAGQSVVFLQEVTFPGLYKDDQLNLPDGMTVDMFTIPIVSEAVQEIVGITDPNKEGMAYATFQYVASQSADTNE